MDAVDAAFAAVPRAGFLPATSRARAELDAPILIGHGQTNSQPRTVEAMLRLLEVARGQRVLDVGAGSGWTTALLSHLVGAGGEVVGVELVPELVAWGQTNLDAHGVGNARIEQAAGLGWPASSPYDRILVSAEARRLPPPLLAQLAEPGRMVLPVRGRMVLVVRAGGADAVSEHGYYRFVPLLED